MGVCSYDPFVFSIAHLSTTMDNGGVYTCDIQHRVMMLFPREERFVMILSPNGGGEILGVVKRLGQDGT
jgi:hypothetical protein